MVFTNVGSTANVAILSFVFRARHVVAPGLFLVVLFAILAGTLLDLILCYKCFELFLFLLTLRLANMSELEKRFASDAISKATELTRQTGFFEEAYAFAPRCNAVPQVLATANGSIKRHRLYIFNQIRGQNFKIFI